MSEPSERWVRKTRSSVDRFVTFQIVHWVGSEICGSQPGAKETPQRSGLVVAAWSSARLRRPNTRELDSALRHTKIVIRKARRMGF